MTDPQRKLTVRVKLAPESGPDVTETPQYAYRWDRIALVGLVLVVLVALLFRALLAPDPAPADSAGAADPGDRAIVTSPPVPEAEPEPAERAGEPANAIPEPEAPTAPAPPEKSLPAVRQDTAVAAAPTATPPAEPPSTQPPAEQPPTAIAGPSEPTASGSRGAAGAERPAPTPAAASARDGILAAGATRILSDNVTRFVLTDAVRELEPVGGVSDIRARPPGGPVAVFAFSDVRGLAGETLYYRWIRDEKVAANVKVRVGSDRWRSYSSKFINEAMRGPWRVELRNSAGDLLAHADFDY